MYLFLLLALGKARSLNTFSTKNSKLVLASQFVDSKMSDVKFFYSKFFYLKLSATYTFKLSGIKIFLNDLILNFLIRESLIQNFFLSIMALDTLVILI